MISNRAHAVLLALVVMASAQGVAEGACISGRDGRHLLEQGQVVPFPDAMRRSGVAPKKVVEVKLCDTGAGFVYRVRVLQKGGRIKAMNIPAN